MRLDEREKKNFQRNFTHLMTENKFCEVDIANKLNVSQGAVSHWRCGRAVPRGETLVKLANILGATPMMMFRHNDTAMDCIDLSDEEQILNMYRSMSPAGKEVAKKKMYELAHIYWYEREEKQVVNLL